MLDTRAGAAAVLGHIPLRTRGRWQVVPVAWAELTLAVARRMEMAMGCSRDCLTSRPARNVQPRAGASLFASVLG